MHCDYKEGILTLPLDFLVFLLTLSDKASIMSGGHFSSVSFFSVVILHSVLSPRNVSIVSLVIVSNFGSWNETKKRKSDYRTLWYLIQFHYWIIFSTLVIVRCTYFWNILCSLICLVFNFCIIAKIFRR